MRRVLPLLTLVGTLLPAPAVPPAAAEPGHLVAAAAPQAPVLRLPLSGDAWLQQTFSVLLAPGPNDLSFAFGRLEVSLDDLDLAVLSPTAGVSVAAISIPPDARDTIIWELDAEQACQATLALSHPLKGIDRRVDYTAILHADGQNLDVAAKLVVANHSKLVFDSAKLLLPDGRELTAALPQGDTFELPLFSAPGVAYKPRLIYDTDRYGTAVAAVLRLGREGDDTFSAGSLTGGKITFRTPGDAGGYVGDDNLPLLPPHEPVDVKLGAVPEITVTRTLVASTQAPVKSDVRGKLALFNQEDDVELEVKNLRPTPVTVTLRDNIAGDWTMLRSSLPYTKFSAGTVEFLVSLQPGEAQKVKYLARRNNLQP